MQQTDAFLSLDTFIALANLLKLDVFVITNANVTACDTMYVARETNGQVYVATRQSNFDLVPVDPSKPVSVNLYSSDGNVELKNVFLSLDAFLVLAAEAGLEVYEVVNAYVNEDENVYLAIMNDGRCYVATKTSYLDLKPIDPERPINVSRCYSANAQST